MARTTVKVTLAQKAAAEYIVERSEKSGKAVSKSIRKIADAQEPRRVAESASASAG